MGHLLKIRNRESQFLLPVCEMRNWEPENNSFSIPFTIPLIPIPVPIPPKYPTKLELEFLGIGILPPLDLGTGEFELEFGDREGIDRLHS